MDTRAVKEYYIRLVQHNRMLNNGCSTPLYFAVVFFVIVVFFASCKPLTKIEYRDRVVDHYITNTVHDTLVDKTTDSVCVNIYTKGDTVFQDRYKEKTRWRDRVVIKNDTCWRDSVVTEFKETVKEVVKIPKIYTYSLIFSILVIIFAVYKVLRWLKVL